MAEAARILVVDDEMLNRELLMAMIETLGHDVEEAENGFRALELTDESIDLVLLDIMMPGMDGMQVLERLKADPARRHIPVVMISALSELDTIVRCIDLGADDYLPKPFNPTLLKARIGNCLEKKRLRDEERALHRQLAENYERLKELESMRDSLTHMIVHDLRTPLTSLLTGLQTMEAFGELNEDQEEFLEMAIGGGETLLGMINDLLDISKMEEGSLKLDYGNVETALLTEQALKQIGHLAKEKSLTLRTEVDPDLPTLDADEEKLRRTLVNLLGNALKFTPSGGAITLSARRQDGSVRFAVTDTGEGIPEEAFGKIFEKFGQVENRKAGRKMSTGLGLTFCKMAVEAHGGRIWVESRLGQGSTFFFTIPINRPL